MFCNRVTASDVGRTDTYGAAKKFPAKLNGGLVSTVGNAQDVADAVLRIMETPAGQKQLRYRISPASFGVDEINKASAEKFARSLRYRCRH